MSDGKMFHSRAPATAKAWSPTVAHCDWGTSSWCVSEDRRRRLDAKSDKRRRSAARYDGTVPFRERKTIVASLNCTRSGALSQRKLASVSVMCSERRRPAMDRAAALSTDWRRLYRLLGKPASTALP